MEEDALRERGFSAEEARTAAERAFGNRTAAVEHFHESQRWLWWDHLRQDIRFALRTLARSPGFAVAAIITLSVGIGANTAIFSAMDDALLRPFPLPNAHQLATVYSFDRKTNRYVSTSYPDFEDFRRRSRSFQQLSGYLRLPLNITMGAHAERITVEGVTDNYFAMLELPALVGRTLGSEDERPGAPPAAMIGESLWRDRFHSDRTVVGKPIYIEDHAFRIVGIVPGRYTGINLNWDETPRIWIAIHMAPLVVPGLGTADVFHRRVQFMPVAGRLRPGVTPVQAQAELQGIAASLAQTEPTTNRDLTASVFELSRSKFWPSYRQEVELSLLILWVAAGLVLLLACANVSNLLLQRALDRRREFAIRLAIGAGRSRLTRQLMTESFLLALPSFALALVLAKALGQILLRFAGAFGLDLTLDLSLETRVLAFSAIISFGAAFLFGLAPAMQATRPELSRSLKDAAGNGPADGRIGLRQCLVVVQIAFSFILLAGGGLFGRTLWTAWSIDPGFDPRHLLVAEYSFPQSQIASAERVGKFRSNLASQLAALPGIESVVVANPPLTSFRSTTSIGDSLTVEFDNVGAGFFRAMAIPVLRGREFGSADRMTSPRVAVVNQTLAHQLAPGGDVIGRVFQLSQGRSAQIVGIARDAKYHSVWDSPAPHLYLDILQTANPGATLIARTRGRPESVIPEIRREWERVAPGVPFLKAYTGEDQVNRSLAPQRAAAALLGGFALLAVILASVGLFSSIAHSVMQRTREIGIRIAIGARPRSIVKQVLARALALASVGIAAGAGASLAMTRLVSSQLRGVDPWDRITFAVVTVFVIATSVTAASIPAWRAARIDPARTLRWE